MMQHILFYDGECGFCDSIVQFVLKRDREKRFQFAPLQGETAKELLADLPEEQKGVDSLVLIEDYGTKEERTLIQGKGALRVAWHLPVPWKILGILSFLPSFLFDWGYAMVACNRHQIKGRSCKVVSAEEKKRFLP